LKKTAANPKTRRPVGRPPLDQADHKRILDATAKVFLEYGFERASTSEIARRAHTSKQTLYQLFPSKAELFVAVIGSHTEQLFARHDEYLASDAPPRAALSEIAYSILKLFTAPDFLSLYRTLVAEAERFPELARQLWQHSTMRGHALMAEYLRSRRIGGPNYRKTAPRFVSFVLGDYLVNVMLNPDLKLSDRALRARACQAVDDFLHLHPARAAHKD
jgi:TetR/AcrR family transcriptional regulator, mexJK operon transcriptional repressor